MSTPTQPWVAALAGAATILILAGGGCSSRTTVTSGCTIAPTVQGDAFCDALAAYDGRCGHCQDCTAHNLQHCAERGAALSDAYRAAFIACQGSAGCNADPAFSPCVEQQLAQATPTAAQAQAKDAFCATCGATVDCANFFAVDPASGNQGPGYNVLLYDDDVATQALGICDKYCDAFDYAVCVALVACGPTGGDYCDDGGLCAAH